jgi:hypothetical protein
MCLVTIAATVTGCVERKLTVTSQPEGALVYVNNQEIGRTPLTRDFTYYGDFDVTLRREGYQTLKTHRQVTAPWWQWPPIDLFAELLPLTDDRSMSFMMEPASTQPTDPAALLTRAAEMRQKLESSPHTRRPATHPGN